MSISVAGLIRVMDAWRARQALAFALALVCWSWFVGSFVHGLARHDALAPARPIELSLIELPAPAPAGTAAGDAAADTAAHAPAHMAGREGHEVAHEVAPVTDRATAQRTTHATARALSPGLVSSTVRSRPQPDRTPPTKLPYRAAAVAPVRPVPSDRSAVPPSSLSSSTSTSIPPALPSASLGSPSVSAASSSSPAAQLMATPPTGAGAGAAPGKSGMGPAPGLNGNARAIDHPLPALPDDLRDVAYHASALARFTVHADGSVAVELLKPTALPRLNQLLLAALGRWRFVPALKNGRPVDSSQDVRVHFNVD